VQDVRPTDPANKVVAVLVSDIHLSQQAPSTRITTDGDWFGVMAYSLQQLTRLSSQYDVDIIAAGDIFDKWNSSPELISFALRELPSMYSIPGQHDLPCHNFEDRKKSAYWTLVEAGRLQDISNRRLAMNGFAVTGVPYGADLDEIPIPEKWTLGFELLAIHRYLWIKDDQKYVGASDNFGFNFYKKIVKNFDAVLFGDNHITVTYNLDKKLADKPSVFNPGSFMRRTIAQVLHQPIVGLLHADASITPYFIQSSDKFLSVEDVKKLLPDIKVSFEQILETLKESMTEVVYDFKQIMKQFLEGSNLSDSVKNYINEAMENVRK
jgi:hypothetical protein